MTSTIGNDVKTDEPTVSSSFDFSPIIEVYLMFPWLLLNHPIGDLSELTNLLVY